MEYEPAGEAAEIAKKQRAACAQVREASLSTDCPSLRFHTHSASD